MGVFDYNFPIKIGQFKYDITRKIERVSREWYQSNFDMGGWKTGPNTVRKWRKRKKSYGHPQMNEHGTLRDSIKTKLQKKTLVLEYGNAIKSRKTRSSDYGRYHNTGDTRDGVQRKFIGASGYLNKKIEKMIVKDIMKIFA